MRWPKDIRMLGVILTLLLVLPARAWAQVLNYDAIFERPTLTGNWGGARDRLEDQGIQLGGDEIAETLGNPEGGRRQGWAAEGRFEVFANLDLDKVMGWHGAIFHANAYQIHGQGLTAHDLGNLVSVSNIESRPGTRLFDLWVQQSLLDNALSLRFGQLAADDEFFVSQYAPLFVNSTFGWPAILGVNLPDGGPAYPVARPGLRARLALSPRLTVTAGLFSGDPVADASGFDFHMNGDLFAISELAASMTNFSLPATFKLGGWIHSGHFQNQRYDTAHFSLADPASGGIPASRRGDYGGYAILDQLLWRRDGTSDSGLGAFLRLGGNSAERNLIQFHADGGLTFAGPFGRDNDTVGLAMSYEEVSAAQAGLAQDYQRITGVPVPAPDFESALELSYQAQLASWWIIQPDMQWIIHPGGRVLDLKNPLAGTSAGALVLGLRTALAL
jgi:porin